jgi:hypothetical protein
MDKFYVILGILELLVIVGWAILLGTDKDIVQWKKKNVSKPTDK